MDRLRPWAMWGCLVAIVIATALSAGERFVGSPDRPGLGIAALVVSHGLLLMVIALAALPLVAGNRLTGSVSGIVTLIVGILSVIGGIALALRALAELILMVGLFLAIPFGTAAYTAGWGSFPIGTSTALLTTILILDIVGAVLLVVAQQRFLGSKGLMALIATTLLLTLITLVLHSVVPRLLVSIVDAVAAIISAVVAAIWALILLIGGIVAIVKLIAATRGARARTAVTSV